MFEWISDPHMWMGLATLTALEIVLGIDNIVFLSVIVSKLPQKQQASARRIGLIGAMGMRLALLACIAWVMELTTPLFSAFGKDISGRDLILIIGGLFLIAKASKEIHHSIDEPEEHGPGKIVSGFAMTIAQIMLLDIIFSLDSVITAVGLVDHISIMMIAVVLSVLVMLVAAKTIGEFVEKHPSVKMLALSFLILVGFVLLLDGLAIHIPKGYIYFAMAFSLSVETLNLLNRKRKLKRRAQEST
ncbi:TerC family protein [Thalassospira lucentensis]|uniref:TerC family protein n=2 Tax=Thalassospira lucentensis TaxID=168935 RepID=A0A3D5NEL2_9PROT|nr:TerC family protein [Thalassospira lucentensis]RCK19068.1 membrane protein [Thalassospira lucentensis MCCC 1A00383 = DSM 14000]HCW69856.1 TerC family protein [Thalassospira lucentensis]